VRCKKFKGCQPRGGRISASIFDRPSDATTAQICTPRARILWCDWLAVRPDVLLAEPPQKWQGRYPHPQQKKIPRVRTGRHGVPAERWIM